MPNLVITYSDHTMTDYSGTSVTTRTFCSKIDGIDTLLCASSPTTADVSVIKASLRTLLIDRGFTWTTEV